MAGGTSGVVVTLEPGVAELDPPVIGATDGVFVLFGIGHNWIEWGKGRLKFEAVTCGPVSCSKVLDTETGT